MRTILLIAVVLLVFDLSLVAQNLTIQPYLQDASPQAISILWETDTNEETTVFWGTTTDLGQQTAGISYPTASGTIVHEARIDSLQRFTSYFYSVQTGTTRSDTFTFKTPPFASDQQDFRIVAMSDMQKDNSRPDKYREIVTEGVISYLTETLDGALIDNLALVMIPGDLVQNGNSYNQWKDDFFAAGAPLFNQVPVYPVLGNHENNASYYFTYFKLPENGSPEYTEHWWYKDYGNLRIVGLNSNGTFANTDQLSWLNGVLTETCEADSIDFVFAQLHHPHKSELWTPGESGFTGEVIERLEDFTTSCGKPSIHFFGHTHGYSRGQSRDHKHLWINVASAGGAIDNWGEFPNADYEEFSVSQDEYGFVLVEVSDGPEGQLHLKRISRGDQDVMLDNVVTDSLTIRLAADLVHMPQASFPPANAVLVPECISLAASPFSSPEATAFHAQSHWQVTTLENGFNTPVVESWTQYENWYNEVNTQAGDDLTDEVVDGLAANTDYLWRVRYRDQELNWSAWSAPSSFRTSSSAALPNLLLNPGAETGTADWEATEGVLEALTAETCNGITPYRGERYFAVGGLCEHSAFARAVQIIDLESYVEAIDQDSLMVHFGGYLSNFSGSDRPEMSVTFLDEGGLSLGSTDTLTSLSNSWTLLQSWVRIPALTRSLAVELRGTRNAGTDNDSYFDALFVQVGSGPIDCSTVTRVRAPRREKIPSLQISPNPMQGSCRIELPTQLEGEIQLQMVSLAGQKVFPRYVRLDQQLVLERGSLPAGTYLLWMRQGGQLVGHAKLLVGEK